MTKNKCAYILLLFFIFSCTTEKINLSPMGEQPVGTETQNIPLLDDRKSLILYSSEITNLIASFPKFRNDGVNTEITALKSHLRDYVDAMKSHNLIELERSYNKFERSYKKLQKLRKFLNPDEDEVLNRYLVRIKINMSRLNSTLPTDSLSSI
ncbi:hypothetical protein CO230_01015 [Chryseobacterium sp. 6424]|nr:hypothetical protein CO230_01015 [Chryseobacterium sp. 6424]